MEGVTSYHRNSPSYLSRRKEILVDKVWVALFIILTPPTAYRAIDGYYEALLGLVFITPFYGKKPSGVGVTLGLLGGILIGQWLK